MRWFILLAIILIGCGEHPSSKARRERIRSINVKPENEPRTKPIPDPISNEKDESAQRELRDARERLAFVERELAAATKTGRSGATIWITDACGPCHRLIDDINATKKFTAGKSPKDNFWVRQSSEYAGNNKLRIVPTIDYEDNGKDQGRIEEYDGSKAKLDMIIAKLPKVSVTSPPKAATVQGINDVPPIIYSSEVIYYEPAPVFRFTAPRKLSRMEYGAMQFPPDVPASYGVGVGARVNNRGFGVGMRVGGCPGGACP